MKNSRKIAGGAAVLTVTFSLKDPELNEWFLEKVNVHPEHTPMAVTWFEKILPKKERSLRLHKKFFTGFSEGEKKELFER
ncbi:hypothetical protein [Priestia aryabhattai]|uniref:Uncharacterized protein n=1 Tax=Priestia aryabhattai TaxID=412384 RepID=A0ABD7X342_PRIAR|nr:hypothetical protein [Priestia aryabhattai]WEA46726.1 hypothetical protein PWO00_12415 [Priestia aryabhattai]